MKRHKFVACGIALTTWAAPVALQAAQPAQIDAATAAAIFGARPQVQQMSLSPDGTKVAFITPLTSMGATLAVKSLADDSKAHGILTTDGKVIRLRDCHWISNARLVCRYAGTELVDQRVVYFDRMFAIDADGGNQKALSVEETSETVDTSFGGGFVVDYLPDQTDSILMARQHLPEIQTGTRLAETRAGLAVDLINTRTKAVRTVEPAKYNGVDYISDGHGNVRVMGWEGTAGEKDNGITHYFYRRTGSRTWDALSDYKALDHSGFLPIAVDPDKNAAYGLNKVDGRLAMVSIALDGSLQQNVVLARPDVDITGVSTIGRYQRIVGATYDIDTPVIQYIDPTIEKLAAQLQRALPRQPNIGVIDASLDEHRLLILASSDSDPGAYYLFDRDKHDLHVLMDVRPQLTGRPLATMKAVQYRAADGTMVPAFVTLPPGVEKPVNLPAIVLPHGGPDSRDSADFDWLPQFFASQGYIVLQPEYRGSIGYGDAWFQNNAFHVWRTAIGDVTDGGRWLVSQGMADPNKLAIVGWSFGGYAALQAAVTAPDLFKAVIAIAPVTDLDALKAESLHWFDNAVRREMIGPVQSREGSPAQNAARITAPVLLFHGTQDANVGYAESVLMEAKLRAAGGKVQLVTFKGLDHQLEDSDARKQMLEQSAAFLRACTGR